MTNKHLHVFHIISSLKRGGRERQLATIFKFSDKSKVNTKIVCFNQTDNSYVEEYEMQRDVIYLKAKSRIGCFLELRKIVNKEDSTIIWSWGGNEATLGIVTAMFSKAIHINGSVRHGIVLPNLRHTWRTFMLHLSRNIVANSKAGLRVNKLLRGHVMYNGLDKQFMESYDATSNDVRKKLAIKDNVICLLSVANLFPYKDYTTVLYALKNVKRSGSAFHYLIIGEGPERSNLELLIARLGLKNDVTMLGRQTDVKGYLNSADIFIHSSRGEGCSNAILEAMAVGLPVVASDTGGTSEIVDTSVGRLFAYKNVAELTRQIEELVASPGLRKSLGMNAKAKITSSFSIERMMEDYYSILERVNKQ